MEDNIFDDIVLRNLTEDFVMKKLEHVLNTLQCCKCKQCRLDIASYALNRLPSKYVATTQGELISKADGMDAQFDASVTTAIIQGAMLVSKHPRHNPEEIVLDFDKANKTSTIGENRKV